MFMLYLHHAYYIILLDFILMDMKGNTYITGDKIGVVVTLQKAQVQYCKFQKICPLRSTKRPEMLTPKFFFRKRSS